MCVFTKLQQLSFINAALCRLWDWETFHTLDTLYYDTWRIFDMSATLTNESTSRQIDRQTDRQPVHFPSLHREYNSRSSQLCLPSPYDSLIYFNFCVHCISTETLILGFFSFSFLHCVVQCHSRYSGTTPIIIEIKINNIKCTCAPYGTTLSCLYCFNLFINKFPLWE